MLVADIGGGTSDFSLVRVGPERAKHLDRKSDVLAHYGVHVAGTDFDRRVELATVLRELGYQSIDPEGRELPNRVYFDLATWHLINTVYAPKRVERIATDAPSLHRRAPSRPADARRRPAARPRADGARGRGEDRRGGGRHDRNRHGRGGGSAAHRVRRVATDRGRRATKCAGSSKRRRKRCAARAWLRPTWAPSISRAASTGLEFLSDALAAAFPDAQPVFGDRLASVATGLGIYAQPRFRLTIRVAKPAATETKNPAEAGFFVCELKRYA